MKITRLENYRIVLHPCADSDTRREVENLKHQILRHVDGVDSLRIEWDTNATCSFCGCVWETEGFNDCPICCDAAIAEWTGTKVTCCGHDSDCAVHNAPAEQAMPCDCHKVVAV